MVVEPAPGLHPQAAAKAGHGMAVAGLQRHIEQYPPRLALGRQLLQLLQKLLNRHPRLRLQPFQIEQPGRCLARLPVAAPGLRPQGEALRLEIQPAGAHQGAVTTDRLAILAAVDLLAAAPLAGIGRLGLAGVAQPGEDEQFPQAAQRSLQIGRQRPALEHPLAIQAHQFVALGRAPGQLDRRLRCAKQQRHGAQQDQPGAQRNHSTLTLASAGLASRACCSGA
ncbi:Uncharacterised protein [Pseudomonas aeruginosa]|nr:Uncharacterised protein [Pseudomonas aeruginosa]